MRKHLKNHFIPHHGNDYKPHSMRSQTLLFTLMLGIGIMVMALFGSQSIPGISNLADVQSTYLAQLTNERRAENSVRELKVNPLLEEAARLKAQDMIENQYFAHVSPEGKQPWHWMNQAGYKYKHAGENLAIDFYDTQEVTEAWMNSPTHRRNILNNNYSEIGIAVDSGVYKGRRVAFVVQMFGSPRFGQVTPPVLVQGEPATISDEEIARRIAELRQGIQEREQRELAEREEDSQVLGDTTELQEQAFVVEGVVQGTETQETQDLIVTTSEGSFIETVYQGDDVQVEEQLVEGTDPEVNPVLASVTRPVAIAKIIILILMALVGVSLVLKIAIEVRKQHWKNVILALLILFALVLLYTILDSRFSQVMIL
jgi:hypothetical protein